MREWFATHVSLDRKPYTLDPDQIAAVLDDHKNTLVTARAGSGKTRVIVAKIAYLVAKQGIELSEITAFMFNRAAAAEVNDRLAQIRIDGQLLTNFASNKSSSHGAHANNPARSAPAMPASTFHKFALDIVKSAGENPEIISEIEQGKIIKRSLDKALGNAKLPPSEYDELLKLASSFISRAGQTFAGTSGLDRLESAVNSYCKHEHDKEKRRVHQICLKSYQNYLGSLTAQKIDFNILMSRASQILLDRPEKFPYISKIKFILVDEYQDFSYLFFELIKSIRTLTPDAKIFAVGDDWQAINRFAGSNVDYFLDFAKYFPENTTTIPLLTNYRSDRRIVDYANSYMLKNYSPGAARATAFSHKRGKVYHLNPDKIRFSTTDYLEDGLGDARFEQAILSAIAASKTSISPSTSQKLADRTVTNAKYKSAEIRAILPVAKLLKTVVRIIKKHQNEQFLLLHRHNFTSVNGVTLEIFTTALKTFLNSEAILPAKNFDCQIRAMTMHKSKGLESDNVVLLEFEREQILSRHPHGALFTIFGDNLQTKQDDQSRLIYVALTRAKHRLYIISRDKKPL